MRIPMDLATKNQTQAKSVKMASGLSVRLMDMVQHAI